MPQRAAPQQRLFIEDVHEGLEIPPLEKHPTQVTLFRYSAVTWNAHRIHYDKEYATQNGAELPLDER